MKAILIIDMPKNCAKCKLQYLQGIGEAICNAVDWEERPSWCPLKPTPTKMRTDGDDIEEVSYWLGWNDCIDAITGRSKEGEELDRC